MRGMALRDLTVAPAENFGYGYVLRASDEDWLDIIEATQDEYLREAYHDYDEVDREDLIHSQIGLHVDAAQLSEVFRALSTIDL